MGPREQSGKQNGRPLRTLDGMSTDAPSPESVLAGTLHLYVAFDWGDEVDLTRARRLAPAEVQSLPRRPRTPTSIAYRPPPLRFALAPVTLGLPRDDIPPADGEATLFDFAAVSVAFRVPFRMTLPELHRLAAWLADPAPILATARAAVAPLYAKLLPAIRDPLWRDDLSEEYFVFQLPSSNPPPPIRPAVERGGWLAGLVRLEPEPLSAEEVEEALRLHLSYSPDDLFVPDWAAAVLFDSDPGCIETLRVIEFANLQLLEYRHIDDRLNDSMASAYRVVREANWSRFRFWRSHDRPLRVLGELKVEANDLFERTGNVLKLVGDQYLARVYGLLAARFHLKEWEASIQRKLEVAEGVYQVISDQAAARRTEFMELIVIVLIVLEIVLALFHH
jgi:hypothetical protein